jgi:hypothetical protein
MANRQLTFFKSILLGLSCLLIIVSLGACSKNLSLNEDSKEIVEAAKEGNGETAEGDIQITALQPNSGTVGDQFVVVGKTLKSETDLVLFGDTIVIPIANHNNGRQFVKASAQPEDAELIVSVPDGVCNGDYNICVARNDNTRSNCLPFTVVDRLCADTSENEGIDEVGGGEGMTGETVTGDREEAPGADGGDVVTAFGVENNPIYLRMHEDGATILFWRASGEVDEVIVLANETVIPEVGGESFSGEISVSPRDNTVYKLIPKYRGEVQAEGVKEVLLRVVGAEGNDDLAPMIRVDLSATAGGEIRTSREVAIGRLDDTSSSSRWTRRDESESVEARLSFPGETSGRESDPPPRERTYIVGGEEVWADGSTSLELIRNADNHFTAPQVQARYTTNGLEGDIEFTFTESCEEPPCVVHTSRSTTGTFRFTAEKSGVLVATMNEGDITKSLPIDVAIPEVEKHTFSALGWGSDVPGNHDSAIKGHAKIAVRLSNVKRASVIGKIGFVPCQKTSSGCEELPHISSEEEDISLYFLPVSEAGEVDTVFYAPQNSAEPLIEYRLFTISHADEERDDWSPITVRSLMPQIAQFEVTQNTQDWRTMEVKWDLVNADNILIQSGCNIEDRSNDESSSGAIWDLCQTYRTLNVVTLNYTSYFSDEVFTRNYFPQEMYLAEARVGMQDVTTYTQDSSGLYVGHYSVEITLRWMTEAVLKVMTHDDVECTPSGGVPLLEAADFNFDTMRDWAGHIRETAEPDYHVLKVIHDYPIDEDCTVFQVTGKDIEGHDDIRSRIWLRYKSEAVDREAEANP